MKRIFRELAPFWFAVTMTAATVLGGSLCNLLLPANLSNIINIGIPQKDMPFIVKTGVVMLLLAAVGAGFMAVSGFFSSKASMGLGRNLRKKVFTAVQGFSQTEFDRFSTSSLITRTNNDVTQIQIFMNMFLRIILMAPVMCLGGIVLAYMKNPDMSKVLLISMPIMTAAVYLIARLAMPLSRAMQKKIDRINLVMREKLTGIRVSRAFGAQEYESEKFKEVNMDFMKNAMKMQRVMGLLTPVLSLVLFSTTVGLLVFGGKQTIGGNEIPTGDIIAVIQYVMQIMMSVMMLAIAFIMYPRAAVSARRLNEVLDSVAVIQEAKDKIVEQTAKTGCLTFENVTFFYPDAEEAAIKDISFSVRPGETAAIIGSTGSGKSSLLYLIPRFYDVTQGRVLVNGRDVRQYSISKLRSKIGYAPQKAFLFKGTIKGNILFGDKNATESAITNAAKTAQALPFILDKKDGFQSEVAQGGTNLSGGQRQRVSIARAIVRKPEIYLFDDSFSALDFKTDAALRNALGQETKEAAVLIVAQRVSTIMQADIILVLEDGHCVGQGTHKELLNTCSVYQEIVRSQFKEEEMGV